jgi:hypothetical protein
LQKLKGTRPYPEHNKRSRHLLQRRQRLRRRPPIHLALKRRLLLRQSDLFLHFCVPPGIYVYPVMVGVSET